MKIFTVLIVVYFQKIFQDFGAGYCIIRCSLINQYLCRIMSEVPIDADDFYELASSLEASTETGNVIMDVEMDDSTRMTRTRRSRSSTRQPPPPPRRTTTPLWTSPHRLKNQR
jgi:hypothetical protein